MTTPSRKSSLGTLQFRRERYESKLSELKDDKKELIRKLDDAIGMVEVSEQISGNFKDAGRNLSYEIEEAKTALDDQIHETEEKLEKIDATIKSKFFFALL